MIEWKAMSGEYFEVIRFELIVLFEFFFIDGQRISNKQMCDMFGQHVVNSRVNHLLEIVFVVNQQIVVIFITRFAYFRVFSII